MTQPISSLLTPEIQAFIKEHERDDVAKLALQKPPEAHWPYALIMDQIKSRQKAKTKIPDWLEEPDFIFPSPNVMEQASSQATAQYKKSLMQGEVFADLTGGAGADSWFTADQFKSGFCIDCDEKTAAILDHNFKNYPVDVRHARAEDFVEIMPDVDWVLIDPQRRKEGKKGIIGFSDVQPSIPDLIIKLKNKAQNILIKSSPALDIKKALHDLELNGSNFCHAVHVIEYDGDCKEVLYHLNFSESQKQENIPIQVVQLDMQGAVKNQMQFTSMQEKQAQQTLSFPKAYLYEPGPAWLNAGAFKFISEYYDLNKLHVSTHLYTSDHMIDDFPGRIFEILDMIPVKIKDVKEKIPDMKANLSIRNFPSDVKTLRKKLGIQEGGDLYIFACILENNEKRLIICKKT